MPSEPLRFGLVRVIIICKIQIDNICFQATGVVDVDDVGVVLFVFLRVGFGKLALADSGYALHKDFSVFAQLVVERIKLFVSAAEPAARLGNISTKDHVVYNRRKGFSFL